MWIVLRIYMFLFALNTVSSGPNEGENVDNNK